MSRPPLELFAEVIPPGGPRYAWDANQPAGSRLRNFTFGTKLGEGFSQATGQLARRIDQDYPDLGLANTVRFVGMDGSVAYEGRLAGFPKELTDHHAIGVQLAGWMAHAKDRKFTGVYVDRNLGAWGEVSRTRRANNMAAFYYSGNSSVQTVPGETNGDASLVMAYTGTWTAAFKPITETRYDAGPGNRIGAIYYKYTQAGAATGHIDPGVQLAIIVGSGEDDTMGVGASGSGNLAGTFATSGTFTPTVRGRFAVISFYYSVGPAGADNASFEVHFDKLAVYGNHGLTLHNGEPGEPPGVYVSDVIKHMAGVAAPGLDTSEVRDTNYTIHQLTYPEPVFPYDAWVELNKNHRWHLAVWEDRKLHYRPYDLSDYQWEIRIDQGGTTFTPQGDSTENLFNGVVVTYTDLSTGLKNRLMPTEYPELQNTDRNNPWNLLGLPRWDEITISEATSKGQALHVGVEALAAGSVAKQPGTITVKHHILDRGGNWQQAWKPRAGDLVKITNYANDPPRMITETSYNNEDKTMQLSIDKPSQSIASELDRLWVTLGVSGST